jgi:glutamate synthase domain-containing protein 3
MLSSVTTDMHETARLDVRGLPSRELNAKLKELARAGVRRIELRNVYGQRYIGTGLRAAVEIEIFGIPGNDLGAFMDGPRIIVRGNAQDGCGNTMNEGEIVVHGNVGDVLALCARGGKIFVKGDAGYRAAVHMKEYQAKRPTVVIGGTAQDFVAEYMAGGVVLLLGLGLKEGQRHTANFVGTGMHGGVVYVRGEVCKSQLGKEVDTAPLDENDWLIVRKLVEEFVFHFGGDSERILGHKFTKLLPLHLRPYGRLYAY